ncbi:MAG: hypothetical protein LUD84_10470 [Clostridiales bacterium]|nr:hypothetical protein [Clostridiales bacterium]
MSHYMTSEQRTIQNLRREIQRLQGEKDNADRLRNDQLDAVRRQQRAEIRRLEQELREAAKRSAAKEAEAKAKMNASLRQLNQQIAEREQLQNQRIQNMQRQHQAELTRQREQFQAERRNLQNAIEQTHTEMQQEVRSIRRETDRKLRTERANTQAALAELDSKLQGKIRAVEGKVTSLAAQIQAEKDGHRNLAEYWNDQARRLLAQLKETFRPQLFDAKAVERIQTKINDAAGNLDAGVYETAIAQGQSAFNNAFAMKEELVAAELEWSSAFSGVMELEEQLLQDLETAENRVFSNEKQGIKDTNGLDYWTRGQLTELTGRIDALRQELEGADEWTTQQLRDAEEKLRGLQEELALLEQAGHTNFTMAVSRTVTAETIGEILGNRYRMTYSDCNFFGEENREEYHAVFQNPVNLDTVTVTITPVTDENGVDANHVDLLVSLGEDNSAERQREVATAVARNLVEGGVELSGGNGGYFPCSNRFGEDVSQEVARLGDIDAVSCGDESVRAKLPL